MNAEILVINITGERERERDFRVLSDVTLNVTMHGLIFFHLSRGLNQRRGLNIDEEDFITVSCFNNLS